MAAQSEISLCQHTADGKHTPTDDYSENTQVCTSCGLVLETIIFLNYETSEIYNSDKEEINKLLEDIFDRENLPRCYILNIQHIYQLLSKKLHLNRELRSGIVSRRVPKFVILAYATWKILCENGTSKLPEEILSYFGLLDKKHHFLYIEKYIAENTFNDGVDDYVTRYAALLNLNGKHIMKVSHLSLQFDAYISTNGYSFQPHIVAITVLYLYLKSVYQSTKDKQYKKSLNELCAINGCSSSNITKNLNKLDHVYLRNMFNPN